MKIIDERLFELFVTRSILIGRMRQVNSDLSNKRIDSVLNYLSILITIGGFVGSLFAGPTSLIISSFGLILGGGQIMREKLTAYSKEKEKQYLGDQLLEIDKEISSKLELEDLIKIKTILGTSYELKKAYNMGKGRIELESEDIYFSDESSINPSYIFLNNRDKN